MRISINQESAGDRLVVVNDGLNYGRFDGGDIETHKYAFFVERSELVERFSEQYAEVCAEIKADDEQCGESSPFAKMDYCSLDDAFEHPAALAEAIETYFAREIMSTYLPGPDDADYVINSTDAVKVSAEGLTIEGRCFTR